MEHCYYYLHTNGSLLHKPAIAVDSDPQYFDSDFVRRYWRCDLTNREDVWTVILEALALGADLMRVKELAEHWKCDARDLVEYMVRAKDTPDLRKGLRLFLKQVLGSEPDEWFDWLAATPKGADPDFKSMPTNMCSSAQSA